MYYDVIDVRYLEGYKLEIVFNNGKKGGRGYRGTIACMDDHKNKRTACLDDFCKPFQRKKLREKNDVPLPLPGLRHENNV